MSYRDPFDLTVVVRPSARTESRTELSRSMGSALPSSTFQPMRPARDTEREPPSIASDATGNGASDVILVKTGFRQVAVRVGEILYVEAARNYVRIHLDKGAVLKTRVPIDRLGQHLGSQRFLRIHRGRLVNMDHIRSVRSLVGGRLQLTLSQSATIIVARDRRRAVLAEIGAAGERRA
jgi:two-component system LytT family response regulator